MNVDQKTGFFRAQTDLKHPVVNRTTDRKLVINKDEVVWMAEGEMIINRQFKFQNLCDRGS